MKILSSFMVVPLFLVNSSLHVLSLQWKKLYKYLKTKCCLIYLESEKSKISKKPLTLIRNLISEIPDSFKLFSKTVEK